MTYHEAHKSHRTGWLRAAVLGANDGIVSTASLIIGVAAANVSQEYILLTGLAGLVAGAMSMAAGEYVSVSSQADTEQADLELEQQSLDDNPEFETAELAKIYQSRGLNEELSKTVAEQLMLHDALGAHARDEIGILDAGRAQPIQAAIFSGLSFTIGAFLPLLVALFTPTDLLIGLVAISSLLFLALLGVLAAHVGGASRLRGSLRVTFWGALAMTLTAFVGSLFGMTG
ncbi:MAG: VIT family protein [Gammaproteobacteria bacterium]|jgi:vacuolar iron transporter family protein|nr:VIT family protein [Gammaproteobacteria bacterium]